MTDEELFEYRNNVLDRIAELEDSLKIMQIRLEDIEKNLVKRGHGVIVNGVKCQCENCKEVWL